MTIKTLIQLRYGNISFHIKLYKCSTHLQGKFLDPSVDIWKKKFALAYSYIRDSLQLQHSTNLNIQRSQSSHNTVTIDDNGLLPDNTLEYDNSNATVVLSASGSDSNYLNDTSNCAMGMCHVHVNMELLNLIYFTIFAAQRNDNNLSHNIRSQTNYNGSLSTHSITNMENNSNHFDANQLAQLDHNTNPPFTNAPHSENNTMASSSTHANSKDTEAGAKCIASTFESMLTIENKDCEYMKLVMGFKRTLVLPDIFFSFDTPLCHCILCLSTKDRNTLEGKYPYNIDLCAILIVFEIFFLKVGCVLSWITQWQIRMLHRRPNHLILAIMIGPPHIT